MRRGSELSHAKLNERLVKLIRVQHEKKERLKKLLDEEYSAQAFADRYQVGKTTIEKVLTYATWKHVL